MPSTSPFSKKTFLRPDWGRYRGRDAGHRLFFPQGRARKAGRARPQRVLTSQAGAGSLPFRQIPDYPGAYEGDAERAVTAGISLPQFGLCPHSHYAQCLNHQGRVPGKGGACAVCTYEKGRSG